MSNIYANGVDFETLALQFPDFAKHLKPNRQLDFSNPEAVQQLTKSLLKRDFGVDIQLAANKLCPPVPNRYSYILWLQGLLDSSSPSFSDRYDQDRRVFGLDMFWYGLDLHISSHRQLPQARMEVRRDRHVDSESEMITAKAFQEVNETSLQLAMQNVEENDRGSSIRILKSDPSRPLVQLHSFPENKADFVMCNPPFYESKASMMASAKAKQRPPLSACTGDEEEMVTSGGEIAFVGRIIEESMRLKDAVTWYTTMLGMLSSLNAVLEKLNELHISNYAVTEFSQGGKTKRWAVGWSFGDMRPYMDIARGTSSLPKKLLPFPPEQTHHVSPEMSIDSVGQGICSIMEDLDLLWQWKTSQGTGIGLARGNIWSRSARRKRGKITDKSDDEEGDALNPNDARFGVKIQLRASKEAESVGTEVSIRWIKGLDHVIYESFCGMIFRKLVP